MLVKPKTIYVGSYVHSLSLEELEEVEHGIICVDAEGTIEWVEQAPAERLQEVVLGHGLSLDDADVVELEPEEVLCPGMIDTHTVSWC